MTIRGIRTRLSLPALLFTGLLAALLLATGCGAGDTGGAAGAGQGGAGAGQGDASAATNSAAADGPEQAGGGVPEQLAFEAATTDGGTLAGQSLAGQPVMFWFWAPWCTICRGEAPGIADAHERFGEQVRFVGVAGLGQVASMRAFVADTGLGAFPHLVDDDGSLWASFGVPAQPAFAFVAADGNIDIWFGRLSETELADRLGTLAQT